MFRQRLQTRRGVIAAAVMRLLVILAALALVWYGAMTILAALKAVSPHSINAISGYRTIYDHLTAITAGQISGPDRSIVAISGLVCLALFAPLAWRSLPRPYLARGELDLSDAAKRGTTLVAPRAIERAAEYAALEHPSVVGAAGRYGTDRLAVSVTVGHAAELADTLPAIQTRVRDAQAEHDLPRLPVDVTLAGYARSNPKELS